MAAAGSAPPGLLVVDDVQWADDATQQVLAHLVHRGGDDGPCLIVTQRSGEVGDSGPLSRALGDRLRDGAGVAIRLGRLSPGRRSPSWSPGRCPPTTPLESTEEVIRESEGLPVPRGRVPRRAGRRARPPRPTSATCCASRLASLTDGAAQLLTTASVIGRSFTFDVVRAASGRSDDEAVTGLDELIARGLVEERATPGRAHLRLHPRPGPAARVRPDVARSPPAPAPPGRRGAAGGGAARGVGGRRWPRSVAHHERLAGRDDLAAEHFRQAGDHARAVYANADARTHYDAALALGHPAVAELHEAIGDLRDARRSVRRRRRRATSGPPPASTPTDVARIEGKLGGVHQRRGQWSTAEQHYQEALAALGDDGSLVDRARLTADLAITAHRQGDTDRAAELADRGASAWRSRPATTPPWPTPAPSPGLLAAGRGDLADRPGAARRRASSEPAGSAIPPPRWRPPTGSRASSGWRATSPRADDAARRGARGLRRPSATATGRRPCGTSSPRCCTAWGGHEEAMDELKRAVAIFADIGVEGGSIQTEVWRLSEWVDHSSARRP